MRNVILLLILAKSSLSFGQYCTSTGPSANVDSNVESVSLTGENSSINHAGCPGVIGLDDQTAQTVYLNANSTYTLNVLFGTCDGFFPGVGEAWIDYNRDEIFDPSESIGTWSGTPPVSVSAFIFTVPGTSSEGVSRLRVIQSESGSLPIDPCAAMNWGSAMDFTLFIQNGGVDCSSVEGNSIETAIEIPSLPYTDTGSTAVCYISESDIYNSPDVFYRYILDGQEMVNVSLCNSDFDTYLAVYNSDFDPIFFNDDGTNCSPNSEIIFSTVDLDTIYFSVEGWGNESGDYIINVEEDFVGIENKTKVLHSVYPNPASSTVNIEGDLPEFTNVEDDQGRIIKQITLSDHIIDVSDLSKGFYVFSFHYADQVIRKKLIIE